MASTAQDGSSLGSSSVRYVDAVRSGGRQALVGPLISLVYAIVTWSQPHRPAMLATAVLMLAINATIWLRAEALARSVTRSQLRWIASVINIGCLGALTALSGGVA